MIGPVTICDACARFRGANAQLVTTCDAYPDGIPDDIILLGYDHRRPYPGDAGLTFELDPRPAAADHLAEYAAFLARYPEAATTVTDTEAGVPPPS